MTRHLQQPYHIWPLEDLVPDNEKLRKPGLASANLPTSLSIAKCDNPLATSTCINEQHTFRLRQTGDKSDVNDSGDQKTETPRTSIEEVLETVELLEAILSHLPMTTLYRNRQTCIQWRLLIETSPSLRKALWMDSTVTPVIPKRWVFNHQVTTKFELNPIIQDSRLITSKVMNEDDQGRRFYFANIHFPARWRIDGAFWRDMQITSPPIKRVFLRSSWLEKYVECEGGVTVGVLADLLEFQTGRLFYFHCD